MSSDRKKKKDEGLIYACGSSKEGQCGLGDRTERDVPTLLEFDKLFVKVYARAKHSAAIARRDSNFFFFFFFSYLTCSFSSLHQKENGQLYTW
jgi:hypothetical protein